MRDRWTTRMWMVGVSWMVAAGLVAADEPAKSVDTKPADTVAVERRPFEAVLELKGAFEPAAAAVIAGRAESFTQPLPIVRVVPHGTRVAAGDVILELAADKIDRAIADLESDIAVADRGLEVARRELSAAEALHPLEMAEAERQKLVADEDLARFKEVGRAVAEEAARFAVASAEQRLRSAREELGQLERMYEDKDLTEETEEMILERTRFDVTAAEQGLRQQKVAAEESLTLDLPRRAVELERAARRAAVTLEKSRATLPLQLEQKRLGVAKLGVERAESSRKLEELRRDRGLTTVKAPRDGIVLHGRLLDGGWTTAAVAAKAVVGQTVPVGELAFTVVGEGPARFRAKVEEKDLHLLVAGLKGVAVPTGHPDTAVPVTLEPGFAAVPKDGRYDAVLAATAPAGGPVLATGMTGTARFVVRSKADALTLPEAAVFRDGAAGRVVYVVRESAAPEKRVVKAGLTADGRTEILEGLAAGDRVRTTKP